MPDLYQNLQGPQNHGSFYISDFTEILWWKAEVFLCFFDLQSFSVDSSLLCSFSFSYSALLWIFSRTSRRKSRAIMWGLGQLCLCSFGQSCASFDEARLSSFGQPMSSAAVARPCAASSKPFLLRSVRGASPWIVPFFESCPSRRNDRFC